MILKIANRTVDTTKYRTREDIRKDFPELSENAIEGLGNSIFGKKLVQRKEKKDEGTEIYNEKTGFTGIEQPIEEEEKPERRYKKRSNSEEYKSV